MEVSPRRPVFDVDFACVDSAPTTSTFPPAARITGPATTAPYFQGRTTAGMYLRWVVTNHAGARARSSHTPQRTQAVPPPIDDIAVPVGCASASHPACPRVPAAADRQRHTRRAEPGPSTAAEGASQIRICRCARATRPRRSSERGHARARSGGHCSGSAALADACLVSKRGIRMRDEADGVGESGHSGVSAFACSVLSCI